MVNIFEGIFPILQCPFTNKGDINYQDIKSIISFCLASKVHGIATGFGTEFYTLSDEERKKLTEIIVNEVNGKVPIIIAGGHAGIETALQICKHAEDVGTDGLLVPPPFVIPFDLNSIWIYYSKIANSVNIPIMIQDAPSVTRTILPSSFIVKLANEYSNIQYVKVETNPSLPKISELIQLSQEKLILFGGMGGRLLIEEYERGAKGFMPGCSLADLFVKVFNYLENNKIKEAMTVFYNKLIPILNYESQEGAFLAVEKYVLMKRGIISTSILRAGSSLDEQSKKEIDVLIKFIGI